MKRRSYILTILIAASLGLAALGAESPPMESAAESLQAITIDDPPAGAVFPPDMAPPRFLWRDAAEAAVRWSIETAFADGAAGPRAVSDGPRPAIGEIDPRCAMKTNRPPELTPEEAASRAWRPDAAFWDAVRSRAAVGPITLTITGFGRENSDRPISRGRITFSISSDPVGAPIFYRDVPLMPAESKKGVIQPLPRNGLPLIAWRLRDVSETKSRLLMTDLYTCANCHSFSRDGSTLGLDVDGPQNDKGTYALAPIAANTSIRPENVITWNSFRGKTPGRSTIGFMSQVSPDGRYAVTTLNEEVYVANFRDYRFVQVFYPTRGILGWYDRETGAMKALPGADDPRYVQTGAFWSPDGQTLIFSRAEARDSYPAGRPPAKYPNDPNETPIQYDLYRIPFNGGQGGRAEPIEGASQNGRSNSFPKVSPDGRWIVFVQCRNGLLMRPDSELWIVPFAGGKARRMNCNTALMNSWHSFSPNGRWMVFASKSRSPYTQMFLTHLDDEGRDSPPILIENATAANRAVNIPEFVNIPPGGMDLLAIDVPAAKVYQHLDLGIEASKQGRFDAALAEFEKALAIDPTYPDAHNNIGIALVEQGRIEEGIARYRKALALKPDSAMAHCNLGAAFAKLKRYDEAAAEYQKALEAQPDYADAYSNFGVLLAERGRPADAVIQYRKALEINPLYAQARFNMANALLAMAQYDAARAELEKVIEDQPDHAEARYNLGVILYHSGRISEAMHQWSEIVRLQPDNVLALNRLARGLAAGPEASIRDGRRAVALAQRAAERTGNRDPAVLDTLAAAYAEAGRYAEAADTAQKALTLAVQRQNAPLAAGLQERLKLYQSGTPYREPPRFASPTRER